MIRRGLAGPALAAADTACRPRTNAHTRCYNNRGYLHRMNTTQMAAQAKYPEAIKVTLAAF